MSELAERAAPRIGRVPSGAAAGVGGRRIVVRFAQAVLTILGASVAIFALLPLTGDPALAYIRQRGGVAPSPEQLERVREQLGLDRSLVIQYGQWLGRALRGDLGFSYQNGLPVRAELLLHLRYTLVLAGTALAAALLVSLLLGLISGRWARRWPDTAIRGFSSLGVAIPDFVVALILLVVVVVGLHTGTVVSDGSFGNVALPAAALTLFPAARWTQILRVELSGALSSSYALVAAARGASRTRILLHHGLRNALPAYLTWIAVEIGYLLGGTAVVEAVFSWPGVGRWLLDAVRAHDLPVIQGFALFSTTAFVVLSLTADLVVGRLDTRTQGTRQ